MQPHVPRRLSRRRFITLAAGAVGASGVGVAAWRLAENGTASEPALRAFRSRPDLMPPRVTVTTSTPAAGRDPILLNLDGPLVVDERGEPIWYLPRAGVATANLRAQSYQGKPVLTWWEGDIIVPPGYGRGEYIAVDASYRESWRLRAANGLQGDLHEFVITSAGTALLTAYLEVPADLRAVGGPNNGTILDCAVQEVDIATGRALLDWRAHDHVALSESRAVFQAGQPFDFFHANSVGEDHDGNLLVSARNTWAVYKLDRHTGEVLWRFGGKNSTFELGPGVQFSWQHDARRAPDGSVTLFDDAADPPEEPQSRALVLMLDETQRSATVLRSYAHSRRRAASQGSMQLLANGNAFVGWGALPYMSEFDQGGDVVFDATIANGRQSYRAYRLPWTGLPADQPVVAVERLASGGLVAYASWNGATEVTRWQLLGGTGADDLGVLATANRTGFETPISSFGGNPSFVLVRALDSSGRELGRSRMTSTS